MLCLMPKSNATTLNGFASLSAIAFFAAEENSHSAPVAPSDQTYGSEHVTSEMRSFPTIENAFALATSSSSGTAASAQMTALRQPVSRRRIVSARVSTPAIPGTPCLLRYSSRVCLER